MVPESLECFFRYPVAPVGENVFHRGNDSLFGSRSARISTRCSTTVLLLVLPVYYREKFLIREFESKSQAAFIIVNRGRSHTKLQSTMKVCGESFGKQKYPKVLMDKQEAIGCKDGGYMFDSGCNLWQ
jgi:hypothetical protein